MNMFAGMTSNNQVEEDVLGGGFTPLASDIYPHTIEYAYGIQSTKGAKGVVLSLKGADNKTVRETIYVTNRAGGNTYVDKKSGENRQLPGFALINSLCILAAGKELGELEPSEKQVMAWNPEAKKELPKAVPMFMELVGKQINTGLLKVVEDKTKQVGNDYVPTGEFRDINQISKFFEAGTMKTIGEKIKNTDAVFHTQWLEKNKGQTINKSKYDAAKHGTAGAPATTPQAAPQTGVGGGSGDAPASDQSGSVFG